MILGSLKKIFLYLFLYACLNNFSYGEDKIESVPLINLEELPPTFEEEKDILDQIDETEEKKVVIKNKSLILNKQNDKIYVNLKALDKITAKTSSIKIEIGKQKYFGELEIVPLRCELSFEQDAPDTVAYLQVKDLSSKDNNQIFIFNGWTFASSPSLRPIDHPIYDLWLVGCENV